jgi:hypothetical protein
MNIRIKGLDVDAFTRVNEAFGCGRWYLEKWIGNEDDALMVDVLLDDTLVILKTHGDEQIMLDMGGVKVFINSVNFREVSIV